MTTPLLSTKLYIPQPRPDLVLRTRLIELLETMALSLEAVLWRCVGKNDKP
jgi:ATP/maltotriose-dependent transcriptional regulator MalT